MLRLFRHSEVQPPDYRSDRTVEALIAFLHERIGEDKHVDAMLPHEKDAHIERKAYSRTDHPGCLLAGILLVNRLLSLLMLILFFMLLMIELLLR